VTEFIGPILPITPFFMAGMPLEAPTEKPEIPEFAFSPRDVRFGRTALCAGCDMPIHEARGERNHHYFGDNGPFCPVCASKLSMALTRHIDINTVNLSIHPMPSVIHFIALPPAPCLPVRFPERKPSGGKADPTWDVAFTTKFPNNKPKPDAELATPKGAVKPLQQFLDRVAEIDWMIETQHRELPTTLSEMKANGIDGFSLSAASTEDMEAANIADLHLKKTPFAVRLPDEIMTAEDGTEVAVPRYGDMVYVANMERRIEWERALWACGPVHKVQFARMRDGALGITYSGKEKDADVILSLKRAMKARWLESHDSLPSIEEIENELTRLAFYGKPVLAAMDEAEFDTHRKSRLFGDEDADPGRIGFHAEPDPKPLRDQYAFGDHRACTFGKPVTIHRGCTTDGWDLYNADLLMWEFRQTDRGYAGPTGFLGVMEDDDSSSDSLLPTDSDESGIE
jgi:hypothetical protein